MVGAFILSASSKLNNRSKRSCGSHSFSAITALETCWPSFESLQVIIPLNAILRVNVLFVFHTQDELTVLPALFLCFYLSCLLVSVSFSPFFGKTFFLNPSLPPCMTSMCISPRLPGATWMKRDNWICQELKAGGAKAR